MSTHSSELPNAQRQRRALETIRPEIDALNPSDFAKLNLEVRRATIAVLGRTRKLTALHPHLARLEFFDFERVSKLETYALAASYAHTKYVAAQRPLEPPAALAAELRERRAELLFATKPLVCRALLNPAPLDGLKGTSGYKNMISDTMLLVRIFRESWSAVEGKTVVTHDELVQAERVAERLARATGDETATEHITDADRIRHGAFTLFLRAYDETRRGVTYLRWNEGDADEIAPSLYRKGNRPRASRLSAGGLTKGQTRH